MSLRFFRNLMALSFLSTLLMAATPLPAKRLNKAAAFFAGTSVTKLQVEKVIESEFTKYPNSTGEIFLTSGKFRWSTETPEKSLIVYDGKTLWTQQPSLRDSEPPQVSKSEITGKSKDQILIRLLTGGHLSKQFKIIGDAIAENDGVVFKLQPLKPDPSVKEVSVLLSGKPEVLSEIRYVDDLGNLTKIRLLKIENVEKPAKDLFRYAPPKGAEVTEL